MERTRHHVDHAFEFNAADTTSENGGITARICPYGVGDGRAGTWRGKPYTATVYEAGCFTAWIESHGTGRTKFMFDHGDADMSGGVEFGENAMPIGAVTEFDDRSDGLYFSADFASSERAQTVRELASMGGLTDVSHGSNVKRAEVLTDGYRHVYEAQLWDVSVVVWGQFQEDARITEVRKADRKMIETNAMEPSQPTIGTMAIAAIYSSFTGMFAEWARCGYISVDELASLDVSSLITAVSAAVPADIAAREVSRYSSYYSATPGSVPEIDAAAVETDPASEPASPASALAGAADDAAALQADNANRLRLATYAEIIP